MKHRTRFRQFLVGVALSAFAPAHANIQVYPTRVVLDDQTRVSQLTLTHTGKSPLTYEIVPVFYVQDNEGRMKAIEGADVEQQERSLATSLRYSPRVFTLNPGDTQIVKLRAQPKAGFADGIYRVHLRVQPAPDEAQTKTLALPARGKTKTTDKAGGSSLELTALLAVAVPVYFTHGNPTLAIKLEHPKLAVDGKSLNVDLSQSGNGFVFGDLFVFVKDGKKDATESGRLLSMASYAPVRRIQIPLDSAFPKDKAGAKSIRIELRQSPDEGSKVLQSVEMPLSKL